MRILTFICAVLLGVGLLPVLSVLLATLVADAAGCPLDEGSVHTCVILGVDRGGTLSAMFLLGWLMLVSLPVGAVGALGLVVIGSIALIRWARARW